MIDFFQQWNSCNQKQAVITAHFYNRSSLHSKKNAFSAHLIRHYSLSTVFTRSTVGPSLFLTLTLLILHYLALLSSPSFTQGTYSILPFCYMVQISLTLTIFLPQPTDFWDYRSVLPCPALSCLYNHQVSHKFSSIHIPSYSDNWNRLI